MGITRCARHGRANVKWRRLACCLWLSLVLLGGCAPRARFIPTNPAPRQLRPRTPLGVQLFTGSKPTLRYLEIGLVEALSTNHDTQELLQALRRKAAQVGCDAVIVVTVPTFTKTDFTGERHRYYGFRGTCVVYLKPTK